ncbi:MAG: hypothetical protein KDK70_14565 [Myxococcales bacterium]|nr:hypothetical protein [Myxococcales bacterium]
MPSGDLLVLGQRRPAAEQHPARRSVAWVAVHGADGSLRWSDAHVEAWELAERAAIHDDGSIAVQGRSIAPGRADRTWVRVFDSGGTLRAFHPLFDTARPIGVAWAGRAIEALGMAPDGTSLTLARIDPQADRAPTLTSIEISWEIADQVVAAGEAHRSSAHRWELWVDDSTRRTVAFEGMKDREWPKLLLITREGDEGDEGDDDAALGAAGRGQAVPRLGAPVEVPGIGGRFVARPRLPSAQVDARLELGFTTDPTATFAWLEAQPADPLDLPSLPLVAGEEGFAFWRWYGLVADDERWDDAVARAPVTARAAARWLASEGVCEAFPGESVCGETDTLREQVGFGTDVSDACRRSELLDANLDVLTREDIEALVDVWPALLSQASTQEAQRLYPHVLDLMRRTGEAPWLGRTLALSYEDTDDSALDLRELGVEQLVADGSPAAVAALAEIEQTLWTSAAECSLARSVREGLTTLGHPPPERKVDGRSACELVFALCVLDDPALWARALPPGRGRTTLFCEEGYPEDEEEQGSLEETCIAGTTRGIEPFGMTDVAVDTCTEAGASLDEPYDSDGNCGVLVTDDQRSFTMRRGRDGHFVIDELIIHRGMGS